MDGRRQKIIAGNWKMNGKIGSIQEINSLAKEFNENTDEIVICPPSHLLIEAVRACSGSQIKIGAQNCHHEISGAFTGEISAEMLKDLGVEMVILGHSERRINNYESNDLIRKKAAAAHQCDLKTIICVGESETQKSAGQTSEVIKKQVSESLPNSTNETNTVVAYEPIWAIGTGNIPISREISTVHSILRGQIELMKSETIASAIRILYGGSVNEKNCSEILTILGVDGALVGGASLSASNFSQIIKCC